jgi:hypothetical protein
MGAFGHTGFHTGQRALQFGADLRFGGNVDKAGDIAAARHGATHHLDDLTIGAVAFERIFLRPAQMAQALFHLMFDIGARAKIAAPRIVADQVGHRRRHRAAPPDNRTIAHTACSTPPVSADHRRR